MRRRRAEKRKFDPDPMYKSFTVAKFINKVMLDGKKTIARKIVYQAIESLAKKVNSDNPLETFEKALENAKPSLEIKSRRIGGATYQVPIEIAPERREALATRWIITFAKAKVGRSMKDGLATELSDCYNNQGSTIKKKDDTHKMAEANKAFAHYKW
ncbi:MAG: 30S ribosomal protein S7 [Candidatus Anoxychlamydiales bacterium]|nr:30S ribosomal protein S7 [Candidatus Anoxychlamydiales bacterium]NGX41232.1 30S ribosomal protein S7 [Candidatus Anoxychlamydiales bacterium]HEU63812.1 30S ribosomal protein S7 [Chlamydiota bacterium]